MNYNFKDLKAYSLLELGTVIQDAVKCGYTIVEGWPLQYGYWFEVRVTKAEDAVQDKQATVVSDDTDEDAPKHKRGPNKK